MPLNTYVLIGIIKDLGPWALAVGRGCVQPPPPPFSIPHPLPHPRPIESAARRPVSDFRM